MQTMWLGSSPHRPNTVLCLMQGRLEHLVCMCAIVGPLYIGTSWIFLLCMEICPFKKGLKAVSYEAKHVLCVAPPPPPPTVIPYNIAPYLRDVAPYLRDVAPIYVMLPPIFVMLPPCFSTSTYTTELHSS